jgi:hypothetical protein
VNLNATGGASGNAVVFSIDGTSTGTGLIAGSVLTVTGAGSIVIDANQAGNSDYNAAAQVQHTLVVSKASQTITFSPLSAATYGVGSLGLGATSSSGLTVTYTVVSGPGSISGNTLTVTGAGSIVIAAQQAGNANYTAATTVQQTLVVNKKALTVTGVTANNKVYDGGTSATLNTGSAVLSGVVSGDNVSVVSTGATGTFASKDVGPSIAVTATGISLTGAQAADYTLTQPTDLTADITPKALTVSGITATIANGIVTVNLSSATLAGILGADKVALITTGVSTIVSGTTVTITGLSLGGADAGNYTLATLITVTAVPSIHLARV